MVELAQEKQKSEMDNAYQQTLFEFDFSRQYTCRRNPRQITHLSSQEDIHSNHWQQWAQQDLRQLLLRPNPNVRKRK